LFNIRKKPKAIEDQLRNEFGVGGARNISKGLDPRAVKGETLRSHRCGVLVHHVARALRLTLNMRAECVYI
jgi:hypothetical protein